MAEVKLDPQVVAAKTYLRGSAAEIGILPEMDKYVEELQLRLDAVKLLGDKDIAGTLACLTPLADSWYVAPLNEFRGASADVLAQHLEKPMVFDSVENAWQQAMSDATPNDIVVVCGSFHTVAHVMELLEKESVSGK